jgi:hypothetical protein
MRAAKAARSGAPAENRDCSVAVGPTTRTAAPDWLLAPAGSLVSELNPAPTLSIGPEA